MDYLTEVEKAVLIVNDIKNLLLRQDDLGYLQLGKPPYSIDHLKGYKSAMQDFTDSIKTILNRY